MLLAAYLEMFHGTILLNRSCVVANGTSEYIYAYLRNHFLSLFYYSLALVRHFRQRAIDPLAYFVMFTLKKNMI